MRKVVVPVAEEILRVAERRRAAGVDKKDISQFLAELINLGFEHRLQELYRRFGVGEISLEYFAGELGTSVRELYATLEQRGLPTSNIDIAALEHLKQNP